MEEEGPAPIDKGGGGEGGVGGDNKMETEVVGEAMSKEEEDVEMDNEVKQGESKNENNGPLLVDKDGEGDVTMMPEEGKDFMEKLKRLVKSQKRNYRQSAAAEDSSDDSEYEEPKCAEPKLEEEKAGPSTSSSASGTNNNKQKSKREKTPAKETTQEGSQGEGRSSTEEVLASAPARETEESMSPLSSDRLRSTSDDSHDHDDSDEDDEYPRVRRRLGFFSEGVELEDDNASESTMSSLEFLGDEDELEDESSSSSSTGLEDLEDRTAEGPANQSTKDKNRKTNKDKNNKKRDQELPKVLQKPKPVNKWNGPKEVFRRELGYRSTAQAQADDIFRSKFYGSLFSAERLELMNKLTGHRGCVNCLHFNYAGTKLASGSDDLYIKIWNYGLGKLLTSFHSKHRSNVFQAKFMPLIGCDNIIISCARDSQVRLTELDTTGSVVNSRKLAQHRNPAHKLAINPETPHIVMSCGEDGVVYSCDIREDKSQKILTVQEDGKKVALYSIHSNPLHSTEFCVSGRDEFVRIYDTRKLSRSSASASSASNSDASEEDNESTPLKRYCPHVLQRHQSKPHITAACYNYNGTEIVASYNDENIYLFDTSHSDMADYVKCFEGHLNSATVKGVNFFGARSEFIVSGSDCGHIFVWDKKTESIVNFMRGDENGVVNVLEPHPYAPILATSGLDDDVKIWIPSSETAPKMGDLVPTVRKNIKRRVEEMNSRPNAVDGHIMWQLFSRLRRERRRTRRANGEDMDSDSDSEEEEEEDSDGDSSRLDCVIA